MNKYVKSYLTRGLMFAGGGPLILGIVYLCVELSGTNITLSGKDIFIAILTTLIIAFVHAGSSIFPQIEHWSKIKAMFFQFISLYSVYTIGYLVNSWLPLNPYIILIYTSVFIGVFLLIWLIVVVTVHQLSKKMNERLKKIKEEK